MDPQNRAEKVLAHITIPNRINYLPKLTSFIRNISSCEGADEKTANKIELLVEEAAMNVINYAFDTGEEGRYSVGLFRHPGALVVEVADKGLPIDIASLESGRETGLGLLIMRGLADEISFENLGPGGKRVRMTVNLPMMGASHYATESDLKPEPDIAPPDEPIEYRFMTPDDAVNLARCVYRSYGYSYLLDRIYYPDKVRESLINGLIVSAVATNPSGEIIAHLALMLDSPDAKVGETGQAVTDPRYRGRGFFGELKKMLIETAKERGMFGVFAHPLTAHTYTQKGNVAIGAVETAAIPLLLPAEVELKAIEGGACDHRRAVMVYYLDFDKSGIFDVYPPLQHMAIIKKIYANGRLKRNIIEDLPATLRTEKGKKSSFNTHYISSANIASMRVSEFGEDFIDVLSRSVKELCMRKVEVILVELPLSEPETRAYCSQLEAMGFFFTGIVPCQSHDGKDVLCLEYVNNLDLTADHPALLTDFSRELYAYALLSAGVS